jgi:agmatinase
MPLSNLPLDKAQHYDGLGTNSEDKWLFFGAPYDGTSSYRAGSRFAPEAIRLETVLCQETYSPYFDLDISEKPISDVGNLDLPYGNRAKALDIIGDCAETIYAANQHPFMIGGEHLISLPAVAAAAKKYPDLRIIHLDAHADMADELFGETLSHGTVMRRIHDIIGDGKIYQFGIRSGNQAEINFTKKHNIVNMFNLENYEQHVAEWEKYPIYLTIDLDCFDPSQLPGTGTPETGGVFFKDFIPFLKTIGHLNFIGIDVNELAPRLDPSNMSTVFACKVIRETIAACVK